ncbi:hypothetical protein PR048_019317, partial [Dryococelus australis]
MVREGVIIPVEEPTEWCAPMVLVPKRNGSVKDCLPSVEESLAQQQDAKSFPALDASNGFWQVPLTQANAPFTMFITSFGWYYFNCLPFNINSGPEHYQRQMQRVVGGMPGVVNHAAHILVCDRTIEEYDQWLEAVLDKLARSGITLNRAKCSLRVTDCENFGACDNRGYCLTGSGKTRAIKDMPDPTNVSELRRFLCRINYLMKFIPHLAEKTHPLRMVLHQDMEWVWGQLQYETTQKRLMGIVKSRRRAQESVWWQSITTDINRLVENCQQCLQMRVQWAEPLQPTTLPNYFSQFFELVRLENLTSEGVVLRAKNIFARHSIPETVRSDKGTQFTAQEFQRFAKDYGFDHITSSPKFPQSNGVAESAVKVAESILSKSMDPNLGKLPSMQAEVHLLLQAFSLFKKMWPAVYPVHSQLLAFFGQVSSWVDEVQEPTAVGFSNDSSVAAGQDTGSVCLLAADDTGWGIPKDWHVQPYAEYWMH